jgi:hypothetical protein
MTQLDTVLYAAKAHTAGSRDTTSWSDNGRLQVANLVLPLRRITMSAYTAPVHQGVLGSEPD